MYAKLAAVITFMWRDWPTGLGIIAILGGNLANMAMAAEAGVNVAGLTGLATTPIAIVVLAVARMQWTEYSDEAHCGCCSYIIKGTECDRCPECGALLEGVGTWTHRTRPLAVKLLLLALVLGVAPFLLAIALLALR